MNFYCKYKKYFTKTFVFLENPCYNYNTLGEIYDKN